MPTPITPLQEFLTINQWLFEAAQTADLNPQRLDQALFKILRPDLPPLYISNDKLPFNSGPVANLVKDKYSTRLVLAENHLPNIDFWRPDQESWLDFWQNKISPHGQAVAKPVYGSQSQGIVLLKSAAAKDQLPTNEYYIFEKYLAGVEWRVIIFYGQVLAVHQKLYAEEINTRGQNQRISLEKPNWPTQLTEIALQTAQTLNLNYGSVDFIWPDNNKKTSHLDQTALNEQASPCILEINSHPGLYKLKFPDSGPSLDLAQILMNKISESIHQR